MKKIIKPEQLKEQLHNDLDTFVNSVAEESGNEQFITEGYRFHYDLLHFIEKLVNKYSNFILDTSTPYEKLYFIFFLMNLETEEHCFIRANSKEKALEKFVKEYSFMPTEIKQIYEVGKLVENYQKLEKQNDSN